MHSAAAPKKTPRTRTVLYVHAGGPRRTVAVVWVDVRVKEALHHAGLAAEASVEHRVAFRLKLVLLRLRKIVVQLLGI